MGVYFQAAFMDVETNYEDFVNIEGTVANPLNYAPAVLKDGQLEEYEGDTSKRTRIPMSQLSHLPPKSKDNSIHDLHPIFRNLMIE